jgi:hypothetical protein
MGPNVVLVARLYHRQFIMSPIDSAVLVLYRLSVDVFRLGCTVEKLFDIFGCALKFLSKFSFETNFCKFDICNDPSPSFYYSTLCILPRSAF